MLVAVLSGHEDCSHSAHSALVNEDFTMQLHAGSIRTGLPTSRDSPTQRSSDGSETPCDGGAN